MPCLPPSSFSFVSTSAGLIDVPSIATTSPCANSTSMYCGASGACSGDTVQRHIASSASAFGSSRCRPSKLMCSRFASIEYGAPPALCFMSIGMPAASAYASSFSRDSRSHSRHGAITLMPGSSA